MDVKYLIYTKKQITDILEYYIYTPKIYNYCYENSPEFRKFIDNTSEKRKAHIKKIHNLQKIGNAKTGLMHVGSLGLSYLGKKALERKEFRELDEKLKSDAVKTLFSHFDEVLANNNVAWLNE